MKSEFSWPVAVLLIITLLAGAIVGAGLRSAAHQMVNDMPISGTVWVAGVAQR